MAAIAVRGLKKSYGAVVAVHDLAFEVEAGEIFGLIGPDGAGKTTTFQMLSGVMEADAGTAAVFDAPARAMRYQTGYLTQAFSLYPDLTVAENLRYTAELRRVPAGEIAERGRHYLQMFDLDRFERRLAGQLSGGMKQKLALACALVPEPRVLLLDEPTTGVDPVSRREFWAALAQLAGGGLTIVVATPYLDEAERCHRIGLMFDGRLQQVGRPDEVRANLNLERLELHGANPDELAAVERALNAPARPAPADAQGQAALLDVQRFGDRLDVLTRDPAAARAAITTRLAQAGLPAVEIRVDAPTLENVFVARLRGLGHSVNETPFPARRDQRARRGEIAIGAQGLSRSFGEFRAVRDVNLAIRYGEIYGLLGANGAGKTTIIKMLCGLLEPTAGSTQLAGAVDLRSPALRRRIGYMSQKFSLYDDLSVRDNLDFFAGVYGVPEREREEKRRWVLAFSGLEGKENQITGSLPGGWKQRVAFGAAIMHEPAVLFLDEPTSGVDPLARRAFWGMIHRLADAGTAILVTTHYLEESEQCNRLGFMAAGELVLEGTPESICRRQSGRLLELQVDQPQRAAALLQAGGEGWRVALFGHRLHFIAAGEGESEVDELRGRLAAGGVRLLGARPIPFSMEDVFLSVVERARREGAPREAA